MNKGKITLLVKIGALLSLALLLTLSSAHCLPPALLALTAILVGKGKLVCAMSAVALSERDMAEFQNLLRTMKGDWDEIKALPGKVADLQRQLAAAKKAGLVRMAVGSGIYWIGEKPFVSDDCARALTAVVTLNCAKSNSTMERLVPDPNSRERIINFASGILGMETRAALTTTDIPVPTIYIPQIVELIWAYGQARQYGTVMPLGAGTAKLPRLKAGEDTFGFLGVGTAGMSQSVSEKKVTAEMVTFTANKFGGIIRIPTELEEDTFIPFGQFLARYIARQLAKGEDSAFFLGDGTATYANITGIGPYCAANPTYLQQLGAGKTKPTDATLNDWRLMRGKVSNAAYLNGCYYCHSTLDALLVTFNTLNQPLIYKRDGKDATLDGFPVRWIGVSQAYTTTAAPSSYLAFFGDASYVYLGERGAPRIEASREVFFATDEIAMRALERFDVEIMGIDAMSALQTAAS